MPQTRVTASMLYNFVQCPHRVTLDLFEDPAKRDPVSPFVELLWERGNAYEAQVIERLQVPFVNLREIPESDREQRTLDAMAAGEPLIYGGRIAADDLLGEPDLLRRDGGGYAPGDIKSGAGLEGANDEDDGKPKQHYAVQLALYADILRRKALLSEAAPFVWDIHGQEVVYDLSRPRGPRTPQTMLEEYQVALGEVRRITSKESPTTAALSSQCKQCHWRSVCEAALEAADDLTLVPELGRARREKLLPYVNTVAALAAADLVMFSGGKKGGVPGVGADMLASFQARARLQRQPGAMPTFIGEVTFPPDTLELFFDVETDPMRGLCYLHGFVERVGSDPHSERYVAFFADEPSPEAERDAFARAWAYVQGSTPSALYVYSPYEKSTWKSLARRFPDVASEEEVTALFDAPWVLDLYHDVARSKIVWPTRDLSIKTLAKFFGFRWRDTDPSGAASIEWYDQLVKTGDRAIRTRILEYNEDDCRAMRVLADGIRGLQAS